MHGKGFRRCGLIDPWGRDGTVYNREVASRRLEKVNIEFWNKKRKKLKPKPLKKANQISEEKTVRIIFNSNQNLKKKSNPKISIFKTFENSKKIQKKFKKFQKIQKNILEKFYSDSVGSQYEMHYALNIFDIFNLMSDYPSVKIGVNVSFLPFFVRCLRYVTLVWRRYDSLLFAGLPTRKIPTTTTATVPQGSDTTTVILSSFIVLAGVSFNYWRGLASKKGQRVSPTVFGGWWGVASKKGQRVIPTVFGGWWGVASKKGQRVIPTVFGGRWGVASKKGQCVIPTVFGRWWGVASKKGTARYSHCIRWVMGCGVKNGTVRYSHCNRWVKRCQFFGMFH